MSLLDDPHLLRTELFIDGAWREAASGQRFEVDDPASGAVIAQVADGGADDAQAAIDAAAAALPAWRAQTATARADVLQRWSALIAASAKDLARLMTAEQGKPLAESRTEVRYGNDYVRWFAEEARRPPGEIVPPPSGDRRLLVIAEPVGVVAAITPWNFPIAMLTRKLAPALAAGCTVVAKPAAQTPLCALALAELGQRAGLPAGVLNIVTGRDAAAIGGAFTASTTVRKLSFTGSTAVGKRLMADCAGTLKRLSLELGGNAPFLVFDDADLAAAVEGVMACKFRNAGQTCVSANRILVQAGIHDRFVAAVGERVRALRVGPGTQDGIEIGPLISEDARRKVETLVAEALGRGATCVIGGQALSDLGPRYYAPTLLTQVDARMRLSCEEVFGPVLPVTRFATEAEGLALANDTPFGLAAYFYSEDRRRCWRVAEALEAGMVGVNAGLISNAMAPFGGVKESGFGREGSQHGLAEYLSLKYLCLGELDGG